jgi:Helix-turn-helix domain
VAIRDRLCPAPGQEQVLRLHCDHARYVWNLAVEQQAWWWPGRGRAPGCVDQARQLAEARAAEPWLRGGSSSVQQQALRDFDLAMTAFFDPLNPAAKPGYRSKRRVQGFAIRDTKIRRLNRRWGEVYVPKCGWVKFRWTRPLPAGLGMARVTARSLSRTPASLERSCPTVPAPKPGSIRRSSRAAGRPSAGASPTRARHPGSACCSSTRDSHRSSVMSAATPRQKTARAKRYSAASSVATTITQTATLPVTSWPGDWPR